MRRCLGVIVLSALLFLPLPGWPKSTRLTVQVNSADTGKPIDRASVVVKFRHGRNVNMKKIVTTGRPRPIRMAE